MELQPNTPIYLQIASSLQDTILAGYVAPNERMASIRETAARAQVNVNTALRAYELLEREGIIYNKRGLGYFVQPDASELILQKRRTEFFDTELPRMFARMKQLAIPPEDLLRRYELYLNRR